MSNLNDEFFIPRGPVTPHEEELFHLEQRIGLTHLWSQVPDDIDSYGTDPVYECRDEPSLVEKMLGSVMPQHPTLRLL